MLNEQPEETTPQALGIDPAELTQEALQMLVETAEKHRCTPAEAARRILSLVAEAGAKQLA